MAIYYCQECDTYKDDDLHPVEENGMCPVCNGKKCNKYEGWHVAYNPKPIPDRSHDYDFWHDDHDGENGLCGTASSLDDAIDQIKEIIAEQENEND